VTRADWLALIVAALASVAIGLSCPDPPLLEIPANPPTPMVLATPEPTPPPWRVKLQPVTKRQAAPEVPYERK